MTSKPAASCGMAETETKVGLKENANSTRRSQEGTFPKPVKLSAFGRAIKLDRGRVDA